MSKSSLGCDEGAIVVITRKELATDALAIHELTARRSAVISDEGANSFID